MNNLPLFTYLQILQLEYYQPQRLISWYLSHPFTFSLAQIVPLKYTQKVKFLIALTLIQYFFLSFLFFKSVLPLSLFFLGTFLLLFTPLTLVFSVLTFNLIELLPKKLLSLQARRRLLSINPYTIAITGSFGKTTTKDFLFQILDSYRSTFKTTHSYNTPLGIANSLLKGLTKFTRFAVLEFGAHYPGDISELASFFPPQSAIITGIGPQHLERFGTIDKIITTKFEIAKHLKPEQLLLNIDNEYIKSYLDHHPNLKSAYTYSLSSSQASFYLSQSKFDQHGCSFILNYQQQSIPFISPVFGTGNLSNLVAAIAQSILLEIPLKQIQKVVSTVTPAPHRLELVKINLAAVIDNTYSSNFDGFNQIISDLTKVKGTKALVTPGLVELGSKSDSFHQSLGKSAATVFDQIILVGQNQRTQNFARGAKFAQSKTKIQFINRPDYWTVVRQLSLKYDWVLLENDLPQNY
ncbi:MAG: UDP-N-acetylmuramoyl-tripeptide--D-alanyl-D-alanine ligase [Candidatus Shapirobacteria bacterium]|jgi:UDP-N-acetylmuramoyl-tripeptide--D-alanyl-D-alanine ligase